MIASRSSALSIRDFHRWLLDKAAAGRENFPKGAANLNHHKAGDAKQHKSCTDQRHRDHGLVLGHHNQKANADQCPQQHGHRLNRLVEQDRRSGVHPSDRAQGEDAGLDKLATGSRKLTDEPIHMANAVLAKLGVRPGVNSNRQDSVRSTRSGGMNSATNRMPQPAAASRSATEAAPCHTTSMMTMPRPMRNPILMVFFSS